MSLSTIFLTSSSFIVTSPVGVTPLSVTVTKMLSNNDKKLALVAVVMASRQCDHLPAFFLDVFDLAEKLAQEWGLDLADAVSVVADAFEAN